MGGDHAPDAILAGGLAAVELLSPEDRLVLIGDERVIREGLRQKGLSHDSRVQVEPTTQVIGMDESPVVALRTKPDSSIARMAELGKHRGSPKHCEILISAGNTGACVAAAQMSLRRLPGVLRPGIAVTMPTFFGPVVLCDVGANPEPKPQHLYQYAIMASIYAQKVAGIVNPRVALLSIGGEEGKGNSLVKETARLIKSDPAINFIGNVEGRELLDHAADVVITEGFTGNVVIKLAEGLAAGLFKTIAHEIFQVDPALATRFEPVVKAIYKKHDYHEYGGAPLLGANGICIICHGSSEARTIKAAIKNALSYAQLAVNEGIVDALRKYATAEESAA